ncbi:Kinesin-like protein KIF23 [Schistosoma japonicum]|nr:Kinesin-like protein KIF23 [Schistosoma japonicum]
MKEINPSDTQNVEVFCRVKPFFSEGIPCIEVCDEKTIKCVGLRSVSSKEISHTFTTVLPPGAGQDVVFQKVAYPMVADFLHGKNGLLFTYGVTGSGKTYSMEGSSKDPGILPRSLDVIFNSIGEFQTKKYVVKPDGMNGFVVQSEADALMDRHRFEYQQRSRFPRTDVKSVNRVERTCESTAVNIPFKSLFAVFVSLVEVYNNSIYDLLQDVSDLPGRNLTTRILREDTQRNVYVYGGVEVEVKSAEEALNVFSTGLKRRRIGQTALNTESSRSHCVFTIRLVRTDYDTKYDEAVQDKESVVISQLCLVDLAGSERTSRTGTHGNRLKEASNINNSLMNLRKCIKALRDIQTNGNKSRGTATTPVGYTRVVPYRDARLTYLFKNFFEGDGRVAMLVCVHQAPEEYEETMHVLKFAEACQEVTTYRTVVQPTCCTPCGQNRPRLKTPLRVSDNSSTTGNSIVTANIDDQATQIFVDLEYLDREINSCLNKMSNGDSFIGLNLDFDITDFSDSDIRAGLGIQDENSDPSVYGNEQDSAPEQDRLPRPLLDLKMIDTNPLRTLINRRVERKKQAFDSLQILFPSLQSLFNELFNNKTRDHPVITTNQPKPSKNFVSALSQQWESRLAQQQAEAKLLSRPVNNNNKRTNDRMGVTPIRPNERRAAPAFNPRHRRSRSVGGDNARWLEHQEVNNTPLGTLFTPNLKHRKSVTRVELKDTLNADNYLLHHQEPDSDGNVETKLFKGSIIPTAGGGSAVVFNDVEVLRQFSPGHEQRKSTRAKGTDDHLKQVMDEPTRRSGIKRRYSHSPTKRLSNESASTQGSHDSHSTTSSAYCPISPPIKKISGGYDDTKRYIGIDSRGGIGCQMSPVKYSLQKRSRV